jgi:hypothetical protein
VRSKALVVAYAVHETGVREVPGIDIGEIECEAFWTEFPQIAAGPPRSRLSGSRSGRRPAAAGTSPR